MYKWIVDPGHAWLRVPLSEITDEMAEKISNYSFKNSRQAYLEEDCDARIFIDAKKLDYQSIPVKYVEYFNRSKTRFHEEV